MAQPVKPLLLSQDDLVSIGVMDMDRCLDVVEDVFRLLGKGDYIMGGPLGNEHGQMIYFPHTSLFPGMPVTGPDRRFMAMIGYLGGDYKACGCKWYGSNGENRNRGLPRSVHTMTLNDADTGIPYTIMSGNLVSATRTGAVPGVAAKYLAKKDAKTVGVLGGGVVNKACLLAISKAVKGLETAYVYDLYKNSAEAFAKELAERTGLKVIAVDTIEEMTKNADIITIATSGETFPRIETGWLRKGCLVTFTGAADMDLDAFNNNTVVADNWKMHEAFIVDGLEHPDGIDSMTVLAPSFPVIKGVVEKKFNPERVIDLGNIVNGVAQGRKDDDEIIMFLTGGMPVYDIAWAQTLYKEARKKNIGQEFVFFEEAYWR